jgi:hypothetical protein
MLVKVTLVPSKMEAAITEFGRLFKIGNMPVNARLQAFSNSVNPEIAAAGFYNSSYSCCFRNEDII